MYLVENNGNLNETKSCFLFPTLFSKMRKFLLDVRNDFLIMSNFYLVKILTELNGLTTVTSKKNTQNERYVLILSIFFSQNENQDFAVH